MYGTVNEIFIVLYRGKLNNKNKLFGNIIYAQGVGSCILFNDCSLKNLTSAFLSEWFRSHERFQFLVPSASDSI